MIAVATITKYKCPKCDQSYRMGHTGFPAVIFTAVERIDRHKKCHVCHTKLTIDNVICKTIDDIYGNKRYGFWICKTHSNRRFYPNPIESAMTDKSMTAYQSSGAQMVGHYIIIAQGGFPWKCPLCEQDLQYKDERQEVIL